MPLAARSMSDHASMWGMHICDVCQARFIHEYAFSCTHNDLLTEDGCASRRALSELEAHVSISCHEEQLVQSACGICRRWRACSGA